MKSHRGIQVLVIGDAEAGNEELAFCEKLGAYLAENGFIVVTGGRSGVMEAVSKGACEAGGITVGILPSSNLADANRWCKVVIPTGMGHSRNSLTALSSDLVIAIGGRTGTLTEIGFSWIYQKPIIAVSRFGGWAAKLADSRLDERRPDHIYSADSLESLKIQLEDMVKRIKKH